MRTAAVPFMLLLTLGALGACSVDLVSPSDRACDELHPCQSGQWCRVDTCTSTPPDQWADGGTDGGQNDGGTDGGTGDGGVTDGGNDAGTDGGEDPVVTVTVQPSTWAMLTGTQKDFSAQVEGAANTEVLWDYTPKAAGGAISAQGIFSAPTVAGTYQVTATSVAEPTVSTGATVTVHDGPPTRGLIVWYSADLLMGQGGALPSDGAAVSEWKDLSGNGHHLRQGSAAFQPVFKTDAIKGLPSVVFDGRDDRLTATQFAQVYEQPNTVVLVSRVVDRVTTFFDTSPGTPRHRLKQADLGGVSWTMQMIATGFAQPAQKNLIVGSMLRSVHIFNGTSSRQLLNNQEPAATNYGSLGTAGLGGVQLGLRHDGLPDDPDVNKTGPAEIAEVLVYDDALDEAELNLLEAYLAKRYAP